MNRNRLTAAIVSLLLCLSSCASAGKTIVLEPDLPSEGGVGRYTHSVPADEENKDMNAETDSLQISREDGKEEVTAGPDSPETEKTPAPVDWTSSSAGIPADAGNAETQKQQENPPSEGGTDSLSIDVQQSGSTGGGSDVSEGSLSPFGTFGWWQENGVYKYDVPAQNTSGMATIAEMYSFPTTRFEDANKPPDPDNWYPGQVTYDESTGEATYGWDRWNSTKETMAKYGAIYRGDETRKVCYLTFDCGYEYGATAKILDALRDKQAPGAFMLTGPYVRTQHDLIKRMLDEGHIVGNHTNNHLDMTKLTVDEVIDEMRTVEQDFKAQFPDAPDMLYFRPPAGAVNEWLLRIEAKMGYRTITWSYTYHDYDPYAQWDYYDALNTLKGHLHPGCVYLLHAESSTNAEILPEFIDWIRSQGYVIEPLCAIGA